jgi:regulatory protein
MPHITKIEEQKKAKDRVNIYVDGVFSFGLSALLLVDYDIYRGKEIAETEIEKYKEGDSLSKCLAKAYRFLSYRMRSEKEMRDKLLEKYEDATVSAAIEKLKGYNYVNDVDFARAWVRSRKDGRSIRTLEFELKQKGLSADDIMSSVSELDKEDEYTAALALIESRKKYKGLTKDEAYQKIGEVTPTIL